jgi:uncharacterized protein
MRLRPALVLALVLAASGVASARTPLPRKVDGVSVYDGAGVIDDATQQRMELLHQELREKTDVTIVVVTVPELQDETIDELAVRVGHDWGVGKSDKDEGIVVARSMKPSKIFIATGYGSEGYLPDGKVGAIRDEAGPRLRQGDAGGYLLISARLAEAAAKEHNVELTGMPDLPQQQSARRRGCGGSVLGVLLLLFLLGSFLGRGRGGRGGRGGGMGGLWTGMILGNILSGISRGGFGGGGFGGGGGWGGLGGGGFGGGGAGGDY